MSLLTSTVSIWGLSVNILTGLLGAGILGAFQLTLRKGRNLYLQKRYPVAGKYLTYFEDKEGGETVQRKGISKIYQKGRRIHGNTDLSDGRRWRLDASLLAGGHVSGIYWAEAHYDEGVGSFYARLSSNRMSGMWAGHDHVNGTLAAGAYNFVRIPKLKIRRARPGDRTAILSIADDEFGPGYVKESDVAPDAGNIVFVAIDAGRVVGFVLGEHRTEYLHIDPDVTEKPKAVADATSRGRLGQIKTLAVEKRYQGCGVGHELFLRMEEALMKKGVEMALVPAWASPEGVNIEGILNRNDYTRHIYIERFWKHGCESAEFECPYNESGCRCDLVWYRKPLRTVPTGRLGAMFRVLRKTS